MLQFIIITRFGKYEWNLYSVGKETTTQKGNITITSQMNMVIGRGEPKNTKAEVLEEVKLIKQWCLHASVIDNTSI